MTDAAFFNFVKKQRVLVVAEVLDPEQDARDGSELKGN